MQLSASVFNLDFRVVSRNGSEARQNARVEVAWCSFSLAYLSLAHIIRKK